MNPKQEEMKIIDRLIKRAEFSIDTGEDTNNGPEKYFLMSIAISLIAIAKLLQLQSDNS